MIDENTKHIYFNDCNNVIKKDICINLCDQGQLININVCLNNICQCNPIIIGVLLYYKNSPYALQTKIIDSDNCCYCCKFTCCESFEFIFPFEICNEDIYAEAIAHYLCN